MQIAGSIQANLRAALQCARRLKDNPVHPDTVEHWTSVAAAARAEPAAMGSFKTRDLITELELQIDARRHAQG
jgi:hypothetical protein